MYYFNGVENQQVSFYRKDMGADAYLFCPGPSLKQSVDLAGNLTAASGILRFAITTAYPLVRPDVWLASDGPVCYDRRIWSESFIKVVRQGYELLTLNGKELRRYPQVFSATFVRDEPSKMVERLNASCDLIWERNSFIAVFHLMLLMGAKHIHLVGCDLGGDGTYYDKRKLSDMQSHHNKLLYLTEVKFLENLKKEAPWLTLTSCTPSSPINNLMPYVGLKEAIEESRKAVPQTGGVLRHVWDSGPPVGLAEAPIYRWRNPPQVPRGVVIGVIPEQEDLLPIWWKSYSTYNQDPVVAIDWGMSERSHEFCRQQGILVLDGKPMPPIGWLRKPFAILLAPFSQVMWLDLDIQVRKPLAPLFDLVQEDQIACYPDPILNEKRPHAWCQGANADVTFYDTGCVIVHHGNFLISQWACVTMEAPKGHWQGDHQALSVLLKTQDKTAVAIPNTLQRYAYEPECSSLVLRHYCAQFKDALRAGAPSTDAEVSLAQQDMHALPSRNSGTIEVTETEPASAVIVPTRGDRMDFVRIFKANFSLQTARKRIKRIYFINYPPRDGSPDIVKRVRFGLSIAAREGCSRFFIMEDDDYYAPQYLEAILNMWKPETQIIGIAGHTQYHIGMRRFGHRSFDTVMKCNPPGCSLSCTAFTAKFAARFPWSPPTSVHLDLDMWKYALQQKVPEQRLNLPRLMLMIKHGVGKVGGNMHKFNPDAFSVLDPDLKWLAAFVGPQLAEVYGRMGDVLAAKYQSSQVTEVVEPARHT